MKDRVQQHCLYKFHVMWELLRVPKELTTIYMQNQDGNGQIKVERWYFQSQERAAPLDLWTKRVFTTDAFMHRDAFSGDKMLYKQLRGA